MNKKLKQIFELESVEKYSDVYYLYKKLISKKGVDFETWKYYFFFLWSMIEDVNGFFKIEIDLRKELEMQLKNGLERFSELAEFNFVAGYTISIFPYEFGDYEELEKKGKEMLEKATELKPENPIYRMIYLGSQKLNKKEQVEYENVCIESQPMIKSKYNGQGLLNEYFTDVFIRDGKKTNR